MTPFHIACLKKSKELIECFLQSNGNFDVNKIAGELGVNINNKSR